MTGRAWPTWALAFSPKLAPSGPFATLQVPSDSGLHPGPEAFRGSGFGSNFGGRGHEGGSGPLVVWQGFALSLNRAKVFFTRHCGEEVGEDRRGAGSVLPLGCSHSTWEIR